VDGFPTVEGEGDCCAVTTAHDLYGIMCAAAAIYWRYVALYYYEATVTNYEAEHTNFSWKLKPTNRYLRGTCCVGRCVVRL
jgi:hypothetical protein